VWLWMLVACTNVADREPGERTPITADCDDRDPTRCLLPWPSNTFTVEDPSTVTGLRLAVNAASLPNPDRVDYLNLADGFSRIGGLMVGFDGELNPDRVNADPEASLSPDAAFFVIDAQPDTPEYGVRVPIHTELRDASLVGTVRTGLIGRPARPFAPNHDHVAVVLDTIGAVDAPPMVRVALGVEPASNAEEEAIYAYHAPIRQLLDEQGVDPAHVVRVWDFTTRSAGDPTFRMHAMMDALEASRGDLGVTIDAAVVPSNPAIAMIIRGRLTGAPGFLDDDGWFVLDADGRPTITGTTDIQFRIMVPAGDGDYPVALYGHGTGGDVTDPSFDEELAENGIAKLALRFDGWTGDDFATTLLGFSQILGGSERSTAGLLQALAGGTVLLSSLDGALGGALTAAEIDGQANPMGARKPDLSRVAWVGGSMGGTMGAVMVSADPRLHTAVLNVPGAGWTHMIPYSIFWDAGLESVLRESYPDPLDMHEGIVMAQGSWDEVDGAAWADEAVAAGGIFLMQESIGDPVLPNIGTDLLANALHAQLFTPEIAPISGLTTTPGPVTSGAALEQFRVPDTGQYDVHGFAARNTPAGDAAREQIREFMESAWSGAPVMSHPDLCVRDTPSGNCDYLGAWE
jgi:hypothetical protein